MTIMKSVESIVRVLDKMDSVLDTHSHAIKANQSALLRLDKAFEELKEEVSRLSQEEILTFLKKNEGKRYSAQQLQKILGLSTSVHPNLRKIRDDIKMQNQHVAGYCYETHEYDGRGQNKAWVYWYNADAD